MHTMSSRATFALGCFWCPDAQFGSLPGVIRTRVGYCGGTRPASPIYKNLGNHSECVQIDFDHQHITYEELLHAFWRWHDPVSQYGEGQYASAIFYQTEEQRQEAEESKKNQERYYRRPLPTRIAKLNKFTRAEEYHQKVSTCDLRIFNTRVCFFFLLKHYLKRNPLFNSIEWDESIATKVNGYLAGYGTLAQFEKEKDLFRLSVEQEEYVRTHITK